MGITRAGTIFDRVSSLCQWKYSKCIVVSVTGVIRNNVNLFWKVVLGCQERPALPGWIGREKQDRVQRSNCPRDGKITMITVLAGVLSVSQTLTICSRSHTLYHYSTLCAWYCICCCGVTSATSPRFNLVLMQRIDPEGWVRLLSTYMPFCCQVWCSGSN